MPPACKDSSQPDEEDRRWHSWAHGDTPFAHSDAAARDDRRAAQGRRMGGGREDGLKKKMCAIGWMCGYLRGWLEVVG